MLKRTIAIIILSITYTSIFAQQGDKKVYSFLNVSPSAKLAALGGVGVAPVYNDVGMVGYNPALLDSSLHLQAQLTHLWYLTQANLNHAAFAWHNNKIGTLSASITSLGYGSFDEYDEYGNSLGSFSARDLALALHYSQQFSPVFNFGVSAKLIHSKLESYSSTGLAIDIGLRFRTPDKLTNTYFLARNVGVQLSAYTNSDRQPIPFELELGGSHKFEAAPFGISLTMNNLQNWSLYKETFDNTIDLGSNKQGESGFTKVTKEFMCHVEVGLSIIPSRYFYVMGGYNFRRNNELTDVNSRAGGLSAGFAVNIKFVELCYSYANYNTAGSANRIGILVKISEAGKKNLKSNTRNSIQ
ncbi:MAG: type IX secretion system protein PorQ [Prevotellaceae bacterium]|jgi:hypothetical protein|nr:type IX secretion system protein PorQ [Prevotellaceae bacterium]